MLLHQQLETDRTLVTPLTSEIAEGDDSARLYDAELRIPTQVP
jgi:hypothetical protein